MGLNHEEVHHNGYGESSPPNGYRKYGTQWLSHLVEESPQRLEGWLQLILLSLFLTKAFQNRMLVKLLLSINISS